MVALSSLPRLVAGEQQGYRLVNSKFPPIHLFDDVANADEFQALHPESAGYPHRPRCAGECGVSRRLTGVPFAAPFVTATMYACTVMRRS